MTEDATGRVWLIEDDALRGEVPWAAVAIEPGFERFSDAAAALATLDREASPDVIVIHGQTRRTATLDVLRAIRSRYDALRLPVLVCDEDDDAEARVLGLDAGANECVHRPWAPGELSARVRMLVRVRRLEARARATQAALEREREHRRDTADAVATLHGFSAALVQDLEPGVLIQRLIAAAATLCHATMGALFGGDASGEQPGFALQAAIGAPQDAFATFAEHRATALLASTLRGGQVVRLADVTGDPRLLATDADPARDLPLRSYLAVPVVTRAGTVFGGLVFGHPDANVFAAEHTELLSVVAHQAAMAIDRTHLLAEVERERIRAQEAHREKADFLAVASHEFRTPLTAILGWSRVLRTGALTDAKRAHALETIERNARVQVTLIENLFDVSRITTGALRLDVAPIALIPIVATALDVTRPAAAAKGVTLHAVLESDVGMVLGDAARLRQVVWILLANAVKFTPGQGRVEIRMRRVAMRVELTVDDTGQGIEPPLLARLFEPFRQGDGSATRQHGGLGLGLVIAKQLVELHGGTITASSGGPGRGASFRVDLPAESAPGLDTAPRLAIRDTDDHTTLPDLTGLQVLVVDDEPDAAELVATILEQCNATVATATSTIGALASIRRHVPDVLVSDIGLMGEDGYSLIRRVRELPAESGGRMPAVALTAYASTEDRTRALSAGFTNHVSKPAEPRELAVVVAAATGRSTRPPRG